MVPKYGTIVGYTDILDEVHFEIEFMIHSWPNHLWGNIFQCGNTSWGGYPALFLHPNSGVDGAAQQGLYVMVSGDDVNFGGCQMKCCLYWHVLVPEIN